ncbi:MAG TPA: hypothetical protein VN878_01855, partial [Usitatibacter sp.]|nr:hypothetical protein [Usitatibacter sp.]
HAVVATKAMTQSASHLLRIAYFGALVASEQARVEPWIGAMMVALALLGTTLSRRALEGIDDAAFRRWSRWTVMAIGAFYLASGAAMLAL